MRAFHLQDKYHDLSRKDSILSINGSYGQVREMKVKVLVQQIMKGSENIKENMDHVWRNLEYIEETYEQMFLKTHRIQVWRINLESCSKIGWWFLIMHPGQQGVSGRSDWGRLSWGEAPKDLSVRYRPAKRAT